MNRKKFLKQASSGVLAAALLPMLSFKKSKGTSLDKFSTDDFYKVGEFTQAKFIFEVDSELFNPNISSRDWVFVSLTLTNPPDSTYEFISKTSKNKGGKKMLVIDCKFSTDQASHDPDDIIINRFGRNFTLEILEKKYATIKTIYGKKYRFSYTETVEDNPMGCFLTSACVSHKGLPDDCDELTKLRNLRETVMNPNPEYSKLINEYKIIAPKMLLNINKSSNKDEIFNVIYDQLVTPSIALIDSGKNKEAIEHYRDFVEEMKTLYL
ncbi:hypothetical protein SAMN05421847_0128 [Halpernia humi]|uniref:Uncharacterized protein n=1 Tax=Halpernia humi TaxID=493375 RepID=A0A1H5SFV0_9FLAO|nr:hypothetical protein [Halpernia humi]SEF49290.1 hypothetical protein SAMN05421847_0128 [Halpernia humi]